MIKYLPADMTEATNAGYNQLTIRGLQFQGNRSANQVGIQIGSSYGLAIEDCNFYEMDGVDLSYALMAHVHRVFVSRPKTYGILIRSGSGLWTGATTNNTPSNATVLSKVRVYPGAGSTADFAVCDSDQVEIDNCISDSFDPGISGSGSPAYNVLIDTRNYASGQGTYVQKFSLGGNSEAAALVTFVEARSCLALLPRPVERKVKLYLHPYAHGLTVFPRRLEANLLQGFDRLLFQPVREGPDNTQPGDLPLGGKNRTDHDCPRDAVVPGLLGVFSLLLMQDHGSDNLLVPRVKYFFGEHRVDGVVCGENRGEAPGRGRGQLVVLEDNRSEHVERDSNGRVLDHDHRAVGVHLHQFPFNGGAVFASDGHGSLRPLILRGNNYRKNNQETQD